MCTKEDVDKFYNFIIKSLENIGKYTENTSKHTEYRKEVLLQYEFMKCSELMIDLKYLEAIERYDKIESEFHDVLSIKNNLTLRFNKGVCFYHSKQVIVSGFLLLFKRVLKEDLTSFDEL